MNSHPHNMMPHHAPHFAVITASTLTGVGLRTILEKIAPMVEVSLYRSYKEMSADGDKLFAHYFIDMQTFIENSQYFASRRRQVILLTASELPEAEGMHSINISCDEEQIVREILRLHHNAHAHAHAHTSDNVGVAHSPNNIPSTLLTAREREVLVLIAKGLMNKEIAERLGIGLTTVISHRKNITEKLGVKSVSGLTIYAVMRGYVDADDI